MAKLGDQKSNSDWDTDFSSDTKKWAELDGREKVLALLVSSGLVLYTCKSFGTGGVPMSASPALRSTCSRP